MNDADLSILSNMNEIRDDEKRKRKSRDRDRDVTDVGCRDTIGYLPGTYVGKSTLITITV